MITTTTPTVEGHQITQYLGIVSGEAVMGANMFKDLFAGIRNIVGGRSGAYERELQNGRDLAIREMSEQAERLGANAIVGIDIDYESISLSEGSAMLMITASGTAVVVQ